MKPYYEDEPALERAHLYNCWGRELGPGGSIAEGTIVEGTRGYVVAECQVSGYSAAGVKFTPNRKCVWEGMSFHCMCHRSAPTRLVPKKELRYFNYVVADFSDPEAQARAQELGLPVIQTDNGELLANLEVSSFGKMDKFRRAKLT